MTQPIQWNFREFRPGDNASDPDFARALFSRDESAAARSLVRESIQNSLDARSARADQVRVRFALRTGSRSAPAGTARPFLEAAWPHISSPNAGLEDPPAQGSNVPFLVVEDFGTRGLTGDPATWDPFDAVKNSFFLFFRALGRSGKEGEDRGRWGVGKFVFPMASEGHCLIALTVPEPGTRELLMGRMVLKTHRAAGKSYHPDGHWGQYTESGLVLPSETPGLAAEFRRVFELERRSETGLSIVVPWIKEGITAASIIESVAGEYFLPIFRGELVVDVDDNGVVSRLDASNLETISERLEDPLVQARVALAFQAATWPSGQLMDVPRPDPSVEFDWGSGRLSDEQRAFASVKLEAGEVVGFRVRTCTRPKASQSRSTHFDVFLQQVPGLGRVRPLIVREGITVSEDRTAALQDYAALVVVDDPALAGFVGDAETPAHTDLQLDLVKSRYTLAGKLINLIRTAPAGLIREIEGADREADTSLLAEFFPQPEASATPRKPHAGRTKKGDEVEEVPLIPSSPPRFRIAQTDTGFAVRGTGAAKPGTRLTLRCAYEVRRGNPFKKYDSLDFVLGKDVELDTEGVEQDSIGENTASFRVLDPEFEINASGFDLNRNVVVRIIADGVDSE